MATVLAGIAVMGAVAAAQPAYAINTTTGDVTVVRQPDGTLEAYTFLSDGNLYSASQVTSGCHFGLWTQVGTGNVGGFDSDPSVVVTGDGTTALYVLSAQGFVAGTTRSTLGGPWHSWQTVGVGLPAGSIGAGPVAVVTPTGLIAVYVTGVDGLVYGASQSSPNGSFSSWKVIGAGSPGMATLAAPDPIIASNNTIVVYARGSDNNVYGVGQSTPNGTFGTWKAIGTGQPGFRSSPSALVAPNGTIVVYATTPDGFVWGVGQTSVGGSFGAWTRIGTDGAGVSSRPQPIIAPNNTIAIYATVVGVIQGVGQSTPGSTFGTWTTIGTNLPNNPVLSPSAQVAGDGLIAVFTLNNDGGVFDTWCTSQAHAGGSFGGWSQISP